MGGFFYAPMQLVAPNAVAMAVATDAMICTMNLMVSFLLMVDYIIKVYNFLYSPPRRAASRILGLLLLLLSERLCIHELRLFDELTARDIGLGYLIGLFFIVFCNF